MDNKYTIFASVYVEVGFSRDIFRSWGTKLKSMERNNK